MAILDLDEGTRIFLATDKGQSARVIRRFHRWLKSEGLELNQLTGAAIDRFVDRPSKKTRENYSYHVRRYLDWLHQRQLIGSGAWLPINTPRVPRVLPDPAERFLSTLKATRRPATCHSYRNALRLLHGWLSQNNNIDLSNLNREHIECWLNFLHDKGHAPESRKGYIIFARAYLRNLYEQGIVSTPSDELLRSSDFPKLPSYLPRPLPPVADDTLQCRLEASEDQLHQALLLMRRTGLRIGELQDLSYNCVQRDERGLVFLKVPLGKLHNERLVPMDKATVAIAEKLQRAGRPARTWLIETVRGLKTKQGKFRYALANISSGIELAEKLTSHRLRHTYATSLLNAGMSLTSVMKLLGHRDYKMTLRYTNITLQTVSSEYFAAMANIEKRYQVTLPAASVTCIDPDQALADTIRWLKKRAIDNPTTKKHAQLVADRLRKIRKEISALSKA